MPYSGAVPNFLGGKQGRMGGRLGGRGFGRFYGIGAAGDKIPPARRTRAGAGRQRPPARNPPKPCAARVWALAAGRPPFTPTEKNPANPRAPPLRGAPRGFAGFKAQGEEKASATEAASESEDLARPERGGGSWWGVSTRSSTAQIILAMRLTECPA